MNQDLPPDQQQPVPAQQGRRRGRAARISIRLAQFSLALLVLLALVLAWGIWTQSGTQSFLSVVQMIGSGQWRFAGVTGRFSDELSIAELDYKTPGMRISASGVRLNWSPYMLAKGKLQINTLDIAALKVASLPSGKPASLPEHLILPIDVSIGSAAAGRLTMADMDKDGRETAIAELSALTAHLDSGRLQHQFKAGLSSPWGGLQMQGDIATTSPFKLKAQFTYQGRPDKDVPELGLQGNLQGSLQQLNIKANAQATIEAPVVGTEAGKVTRPPTLLQGTLSADIAPFSPLPLRALQASIAGLNPADFAAPAPAANLHVEADLRSGSQVSAALAAITGKQQIGALEGTVKIDNTQAGQIDRQRLPVTSLQSALRWSGNELVLKDTRIQLPGNGIIKGDAQLHFGASGLPTIDSRFDVSGIDLARLDSRLRPTQIKGSIAAQTRAQLVTAQARLSEPRASLQAEASYQLDKNSLQYELLTLSMLDLKAADSQLKGEGQISLAAGQAFKVKGELQNFDPSRWLAVPAGRISSNFTADGQLQPKLSINLRMPQLQGQYAEQALNGVADLSWLQAQQLQVRQLDLHWGQNSLAAKGNWGQGKDDLQLSLDAPDLAAFAQPLHIPLSGSVKADGHLTGKISELAGRLDVSAANLAYGKQFSLKTLAAKLDLASGLHGVINVDMTAQGLRGASAAAKQNSAAPAGAGVTVAGAQASVLPGTQAAPAVSTAKAEAPGDMRLLAEQIRLTVSGKRDAHRIDLNTQINPVRNLTLAASGGMRVASSQKVDAGPVWQGQLLSMTLSGKPGASLIAPAPLTISSQLVSIANAQLRGDLGKLSLEQFEWTPESIKTSGSMADAAVVEIANLFKPQYLVGGNLLLNAQWQLQLKDSVRGELSVQRQSGDLRIRDSDGTSRPIAIGLKELQLKLGLGGLVAGSDGERIALQVNASGERLGNWQVKANSVISKRAGAWTIAPEAPLDGLVKADVPDIQWLGPWLNPGLALKGKLSVDAVLAGLVGKPRYQAKIIGSELEVAFAAEGLLLPNGSLDAQVDGSRVKLNKLQFSNTVTSMPRHEQFRGINWINQKGEFNATGEVDIASETGSIQAQWDKFPLLQRTDRWIVVSGQVGVTEKDKVWTLNGKLLADGAFFRVPKLPPPSLSSDVVVIRKEDKNKIAQDSEDAKKGLKTRVDVTLDMGSRFVFVGRGLDTTLAGSIRLRAIDAGPVQATGSIRTEGGVYEGYGQQLAIERGILNFQGPPNNPGLNVRALRQGLQVEAGVEVIGTVAAPQVRLVSEPDVPDAEKLSWLVLGRGSDQIAGNDASLLMSAAGAIFGGDGSRNVPREIVQGLGFDEFSVGSADNTVGTKVPTQTIAGATAVGSTATTTDQVVSVGKHLAPGLVLAVERGLTDASGAVKLTWQLTRRVSIIGRTGTESSVDAYYTFSFD
ncbi:translocation/assembly module TamB domain-containing protein [Undibacterium sp. TJN25]|uniref:translocation/assembly module TamB domain-containing protein n=1 Tax=Undibacterium sp. TJN25 TaxID=3413056 RepID=UPI003BF05AD3